PHDRGRPTTTWASGPRPPRAARPAARRAARPAGKPTPGGRSSRHLITDSRHPITDAYSRRGLSDIPVAHTPPGGYGSVMPPPVLATCTEPLVEGAPDLRGLWRVVAVETDTGPVTDHPAFGHVQRIEQCGDRLVVTAGGIVHDMRCDGTEANGV